MDFDRRSLLAGLAVGGAAAASAALPGEARAEPVVVPEDATGMLYDTTLCIGCKACVVACKETNELEPDRSADGLYDAPDDLNACTANIIELYKTESEQAFVKKQCMHCLDPACAGACMIGALQKREHGAVTWDANRCIGCRYCQMACPYNVPKFEWTSRNPRIVKCNLCAHRQAEGKIPACCEVCPRNAVIFGERTELLDEAKRRLEEHPDRYVPRIYGEHEAGGTQVLYLSHVPFEKLGFPNLGPEPVPELQQEIQHGVYYVPAILYVALAVTMLRNRREGYGRPGKYVQDGEEETGAGEARDAGGASDAPDSDGGSGGIAGEDPAR